MVKGVSRNSDRAYRSGISDLDTLQNYALLRRSTRCSTLRGPRSTCCMIFMFQPVLGAIALSGAMVMIGLSVLQEYLIRESMKKANQKAQQNQRFVDSFLRNVEVINGMGMTRAITDRFLEKTAGDFKSDHLQLSCRHHPGNDQAAAECDPGADLLVRVPFLP
jgi:ABC-type protease/lipase transport system fused ATPase/permease subunit